MVRTDPGNITNIRQEIDTTLARRGGDVAGAASFARMYIANAERTARPSMVFATRLGTPLDPDNATKRV